MGRKVEKTRAGNTWSEAKFWGFIRSALRQASMRWPAIQQYKKAQRREVSGKRHKFEYPCEGCGEWFMDKEIAVDHIDPVGTLKAYTDLPGFVERLFCEEDNLQLLCKENCHAAKTAEERNNVRS